MHDSIFHPTRLMVSVHKNSLIARHAGQKQYCVHGGRADLSKFQFEEPNIFSWKHFERSESDARICKVDLFRTSSCRCSTTGIVSYATIGFMHGSYLWKYPARKSNLGWSKRGNSQACLNIRSCLEDLPTKTSTVWDCFDLPRRRRLCNYLHHLGRKFNG